MTQDSTSQSSSSFDELRRPYRKSKLELLKALTPQQIRNTVILLGATETPPPAVMKIVKVLTVSVLLDELSKKTKK